MSTEQVILSITEGRTALGIEFGSTRIKAVLTDETTAPIAQGSHQWENRLVNNIWTYTMEDIMTGLQACYRDLARDVREKYGRELTTIGSIGISAMMHGYIHLTRTVFFWPLSGHGEIPSRRRHPKS